MTNTACIFDLDPAAVAAAARNLTAGREGVLGVFRAGEHAPALEDLACLEDLGCPVFGAVVPGVIHRGRLEEAGVLLVFLPGAGDPLPVTGLDRPDSSWSAADAAALADAGTALVLVDGHAPHIGAFLLRLYSTAGCGVSYLGGGAGSLTAAGAPCLLVAGEVRAAAAVVVPLRCRWDLGARHGWRVLHTPLVASRTSGNVVHELNWRPALEVYREIVEPDAGVTITTRNFFDVAKGYPFGLHREDAEAVVRDPIRVGDGGALVCVAEVPQHANLFLLRGRPDDLITAAGEAARDALGAGSAGADVQECLLFDCVSRAIFLDRGFGHELDAVSAATGMPPSGVLSLGEIAHSGRGFLDFLNKTLAVAVRRG